MADFGKQFKGVEPQHVSCEDCISNSRNGLNICLRHKKPCHLVRDFCMKTRFYYQMCVIKGAVAAEVTKSKVKHG